MDSSHGVDPRSFDDPRNVYRTDEEFYASGRPANPELEEDRPRGARPTESVRHPWTWGTILFVVCVVVLVLAGIALFP
ncbi:hypothetical protein [Streptomyces acidicola]|uniref:Uncharacterized protein n=1 Tax=Streptomyces acidicola TaxID=2596892 RepID=A0A5N8WX01_9ACTN|nr:hypothetical protein [Streptomyces acidicola]MPY51933.1 hypothetical protein [Streptomyces acidicola]